MNSLARARTEGSRRLVRLAVEGAAQAARRPARRQTPTPALPVVFALLVGGYAWLRWASARREQELEEVVAARTAALYTAQHQTAEIRERRHRVAEGMRDVMAALNSSQPLDAVLAMVAFECRNLLGAQAVTIGALDAAEGMWSVQASAGVASVTGDARSAALFNLMGNAIALSEPMIWPGADSPPGRGTDAPGGPIPRPGAVIAPIVVDVAAFRGCLVIDYADRALISQAEIELATLYAAQAALAIENAQLRATAQQMATVEERSRVARELHDSVTQSLYAIVLHADTALLALGAGKVDKSEDQLHQLKSIARTAMSEVRLLIYELRPASVEELGLAEALHQRLQSVEMRSGLTVDFRCTLEQEVPAAVQDVLFRTILEGLNNILKHARATRVDLHISAQDGVCRAVLRDDGVGFDVATASRYGGYGLKTMAERLEAVGGAMAIHSQPGAGSTLEIEAPL